METLACNSTLQPGEMLNWYRIKSVLGRGGFGITYLAFDSNLKMDVAIKEYSPDVISRRGNDNSVNPNTDEDETTFNWGLSSFLNEARNLVRFKHPNIVRVMTVFEANRTAYMVMEFESGQDLKKLLSQSKQPDENYLKELIVPIIDGLAEVHRCGFIHRDIKPANIYIRENGTPVLLDFGSARLARSDITQNLTALVSVGFTPFEQYGNSCNQNQGPWTDIYSLGAVLHYAITGIPPIDCTLRAAAVLNDQPDPLQSIAIQGQATYSAEFLAAIDWALNFKVSERPRTLEAWRELLLSDGLTVRRSPEDTEQSQHYSAAALEATESILQQLREPGRQKNFTGTARDSDAKASLVYKKLFDDKGGRIPVSAQPSTSRTIPKPTMRVRVSALAVFILVIAGIIGYWAWHQFSVTESTVNSVNSESELENQQDLDLTTQTTVARQLPGQGTEREAEGNTRQAEIAAQQARDVEEAKQAELAAQQARDVEEAKQAELAAQQARDVETARQEKLVAQQARDAEATRQAEIAAQQARDVEAAGKAEITAQKARDVETARQAKLVAQQARDAEAIRQAEIAAQQARDVETARQAELAAQQARNVEIAKQAEIAAQKARDVETARQAELAAQQARVAKADKQAEITAQKARDAEAARQTELALQQAREAEAARKAEIAAKSITDADIQSAASRFNELMQAIRSRNLQQLRILTSQTNKYDEVFKYWFTNYVKIDIELRDFTANRTKESVSARLIVNRLVRGNGNYVLPVESLRSIPIYISRQNGDWSKINWSNENN